MNGAASNSPKPHTIQSACWVQRDINLLNSDPEIVPIAPEINTIIPNLTEDALSL